MHSIDGPVGTQRFLVWHRLYLAMLEYYVRTYTSYPNFFIPYWDWVGNPSIPSWLQNFLPLVYVASTESDPPPGTSVPLQVWRHPDSRVASLPTQQQIVDLFDIHTYTPFTWDLESLHNNVHSYVGGTMSDIRSFTRRSTVLVASCQHR